jgi:hypothetical protein
MHRLLPSARAARPGRARHAGPWRGRAADPEAALSDRDAVCDQDCALVAGLRGEIRHLAADNDALRLRLQALTAYLDDAVDRVRRGSCADDLLLPGPGTLPAFGAALGIRDGAAAPRPAGAPPGAAAAPQP